MQNRRFSHYKKNGLTLVEVLVAVSIILVFLTALIGAYNIYLRLAFTNSDTAKAAYLSEEGLEAVKLLRDSSWTTNISSLSTTASYYLIFSSGQWNATTTQVFVDNKFDRKFTAGDVFRDSSSDIVTSGGTLDPSTRLVTVSVSWFSHGATTTKTMSTYLTNLFLN